MESCDTGRTGKQVHERGLQPSRYPRKKGVHLHPRGQLAGEGGRSWEQMSFFFLFVFFNSNTLTQNGALC